jgi:hypothetical protein
MDSSKKVEKKETIVDLTFNKEEPYVIAKLPLSVYTKFIHQKSIEQNEIQIRGSWTNEEDLKLMEIIESQGPKKWSLIATKLGCRNGKVKTKLI